MTNLVVSPQLAKTARAELGLSQGAVARATLLSRPELSRFENGWLVLTDEKAESLLEFFAARDRDVTVENPATNAANVMPVDETDETGASEGSDVRLIDGICIALGIDDETVDALASEYQEHQAWLDTHLSLEYRERLFSEDPHEAEALQRMLRSSLILRELQGRASYESAGTLGEHIFQSTDSVAVESQDVPKGPRRVRRRRQGFVRVAARSAMQ